MNDFEESVDRELARRREDVAKRADADAEKQQRQATAAEELQRALVDLAANLGRPSAAAL
ncbi:hypothetical protein [Nocardia amamiensis]|uniref:hypothetical protein n=1 Tax=Nocardia TaxID=1817 RepID=UPI0033DCF21C